MVNFDHALIIVIAIDFIHFIIFIVAIIYDLYMGFHRLRSITLHTHTLYFRLCS
jgi:hypothetical protein